jgi:hypothetical protein
MAETTEELSRQVLDAQRIDELECKVSDLAERNKRFAEQLSLVEIDGIERCQCCGQDTEDLKKIAEKDKPQGITDTSFSKLELRPSHFDFIYGTLILCSWCLGALTDKYREELWVDIEDVYKGKTAEARSLMVRALAKMPDSPKTEEGKPT